MLPSFLIIIVIVYSAVGEITFVDSPNSVNVTHADESVVFNCTVIADSVQYLVNGSYANDQEITGKGFITSGIDSQGSSRIVTLSLTANSSSFQYNNTDIVCLGINFTPNVSTKFSNVAVLLVQGPLSSVVSLSYSFINSSTVNISWSPPFTLPGTDVTGYNISATSNGTAAKYFTSNNYYVLSLMNITDSPCDEINVIVAGYNGLDGKNTSLSQGIYLFEVPVATSHQLALPIDLHPILDGDIESLTLNVSSICHGQYPTRINLTIQYSNNGSLLTTIDNIPVVSTNDTDILIATLNNTIQLPVDSYYIAIVTFSNLDGQFNFNSTIVFDTNVIHGVQDVIVCDTIAPTIVLVCVFSYNDTVPVVVPVVPVMRCLVELILIEDESIKFNGTGNRTDDDEAIVTIVAVLPGLYSVRVYDINSNDDQSSVIAYKINELIILPQLSSTITSVTTTIHNKTQTETKIISTSYLLGTTTRQFTVSISGSSSIVTADFATVTATSTSTNDESSIPIIAGAAGAGGGGVLIILIVLISCLAVCIRLRKRKLLSLEAGQASESIYVDDPVSIELKKVHNQLDLDNYSLADEVIQEYDEISIPTEEPAMEKQESYEDIVNVVKPVDKQCHDDTEIVSSESHKENQAYSDVFISKSKPQSTVYDDVITSKQQQQAKYSGSKTILYAELSSVGHQPFPRHEGKRVIYWELQQSTGTSSSDQPPKIPPKRRR